MAKVKVRVLKAIVDGHKEGAVISIEKKSADHFEKVGYVEKVAGKGKEDEKEEGGE